MLFSENDFFLILKHHNIHVKGIIHVGAHSCQELPTYKLLGLKDEDIVWIEAIPWKVQEAKLKGIENIYNVVITDKDDEDIVFNITNNEESSSILELGTHSKAYPNIVYVNKINQKTITLDTFFERNNLDNQKYNFWNLDIQGAELIALKGATKHLPFVDILYLEVNEEELYVNCALVHEIDSFLFDYGFKRIYTIITDKKWGDAIYLKL